MSLSQGTASRYRVCPACMKGNQPTDGGQFDSLSSEKRDLLHNSPEAAVFVRKLYGSKELIDGIDRYCIWIEDDLLEQALNIIDIVRRLDGVRQARLNSTAESTRKRAIAHTGLVQIQDYGKRAIVVPEVHRKTESTYPVA